MLRRLMFFGVGALISIIVLSIGDNRVKDTFVAYINYFNLLLLVTSFIFFPYSLICILSIASKVCSFSLIFFLIV